jgi:hypothetical protein
MAFPWFALLRALPWATILANGPAVARAAERALSRTRSTAGTAPSPEIAALRERLAALEANQVELSEVLRQTAEHTERLTQAADVLAARLRWMTVVAVAALLLAIGGLVLAVTRSS